MSLFLSIDQVLTIHDMQIQLYGGLSGVRDYSLLESAIEQPRLHVFGELLHPNLLIQAGAYLFHLASNHAFLDGNKRTAANACLVFLAINDHADMPDPDDLFNLILNLVENKLPKDIFTEKFIELCLPELSAAEDEFEFWRKIDALDIMRNGLNKANPWARRFALETRQALVKNGIISLKYSGSTGKIGFGQDGGMQVKNLDILTSGKGESKFIASSLGMDLALIKDHQTVADALNGMANDLRSVLIRCGLASIEFEDKESILGWPKMSDNFLVKNITFSPLSMDERRTLARIYEVDLDSTIDDSKNFFD